MDSVTVKFEMTSKEYNALALLSNAGERSALVVDMLLHHQNTRSIEKAEGELSINVHIDAPLELLSELQQSAKALNVTLTEFLRQVVVDQTAERLEIKRQREKEKEQRLYYTKGHQLRTLINGEQLERFENIFGRVKTTIEGRREFEANALHVFMKGLEALEK